MARNWIVYADYFEGFSLSPGSDVRRCLRGLEWREEGTLI
jgi:hypothetical protein